MPTLYEVVRPHDVRCRICVEYAANGVTELPTSGHQVCQASGCADLAEVTWPRHATPEQLAAVHPDHAQHTGADSMAVFSCQAHAVPVLAQQRPHRPDCPAPDPGCDCTWDY